MGSVGPVEHDAVALTAGLTLATAGATLMVAVPMLVGDTALAPWVRVAGVAALSSATVVAGALSLRRVGWFSLSDRRAELGAPAAELHVGPLVGMRTEDEVLMSFGTLDDLLNGS